MTGNPRPYLFRRGNCTGHAHP